jgi:ComF family protein
MLKSLYYTPYCCVCGESVTPPLPEHLICRACLASLPFRMDREQLHWDKPWASYASFFYREPIKTMIVSIKFAGRTDRAEAIGRWMARTVRRHKISADAVVPVPLHQNRLLERGFNQSEILASALAERLHCPAVEALLSRSIDTPRQSEAESADERRRHLKGAFTVNTKNSVFKALHGRSVLLVDDVMTTGSTLSSAASALHRVGIHAICIAVASGHDRYIGYRESLAKWHR